MTLTFPLPPALRGEATLDAPNQATWGAMLVNYFETAQPGGSDDPHMPEPIARPDPYQYLFLPLVSR